MSEPAFAIGELIKLVFALGVTIGLFYALALFMKRMQVGTGKGGSLITVLAALPLGGKEKIWVLDIAGEKLVVGTSPGNVNCLHVLKGADVGVREEGAEAAAATSSSFRRRPESSVVCSDAEQALDPGLRRGDARPGSRFLELLQNFRGGNQS